MDQVAIFHKRVKELCKRAYPYDDQRRATLRDLAEPVGLSYVEFVGRLKGSAPTPLKPAHIRAIVRTLADWGVITTQAEALELLALVDCPSFTPAEWQAPPLDQLRAGPSPHAPVPVSNLPHPLTRLIGREEACATLTTLLMSERLVTLTGAGGSGKTRLALAVAHQGLPHQPDGVWWVDLAALTDLGLLPQAVASALGVALSPTQAPLDQVHQWLAGRTLLLVLDNCEHLIVTVGELVGSLLARAAHLHILTTSRERLNVAGEVVWIVPPLALPPTTPVPLATLRVVPAVAFFVARASAVGSFTLTAQNAPAVRQICTQLDGLPLALELAAAWLRVLNVEQLAMRLGESLALLTSNTRGVPQRHQTLHATLDWSYALLNPAEQHLLNQFGVFLGGCQLDAVEAMYQPTPGETITALDALSGLIDKSLVQVTSAPEAAPRYALLETTRRYALAHLAQQGAEVTTRARHAATYLTLAEAAEPELFRAEQKTWLQRLEAEHPNLRAALRWAIDTKDSETALRFGAALWLFWSMRGYVHEGRQWLEATLPLAGGPASARARAVNGLAALVWSQGEYETAWQLLEESLALARALGDEVGVARTLNNLGVIASNQTDYGRARPMLTESLALQQKLGNRPAAARTLNNLGVIAQNQADYAQAHTFYTESLRLQRELDDPAGVARVLNNLGEVAYNEGDLNTAQAYYEESRTIRQTLGEQSDIGGVIHNLGELALARGDLAAAEAAFTESLALRGKVGDKLGTADVLHGLGHIACQRGDPAAGTLYVEGLQLRWEVGDRFRLTLSLDTLAQFAARQAQPARAARLLGVADAVRTATGTPRSPANQAIYAQTIATCTRTLGPTGYAVAWEAGAATPLPDLVTEAATLPTDPEPDADAIAEVPLPGARFNYSDDPPM